MYHIGFIIEQALGHITHGQNLQRNVAGDSEVEAYWGLPTWKTSGLAARIPLYRNNWTLQAGWQARRALADAQRQAKLDVVFFHTQVTATLAPDWLKRVPGVVSLDATPRQYDALGQTYNHRQGPQWLEGLKWRLNRDCFRGAHHLVAWSQWAKDGLVAKYEVPPEKITVIPPGVNVQEWTPPEERRQSDETVRILFVGGDLERKGGKVLIEAFRRLRQELAGAGPDVELHMVTGGAVPEEPGLFGYHNIRPNTPELKKLYYEADIFCLPTYGDCLPMVLSEAGAAGLPLVSTRVGAIGEIVRNSDTGFQVPAGDATELAFVLQRLVCDPDLCLRLGAQALELVGRDHDAGRNAVRLLDLLKQTADETRKVPHSHE